MWAEIIVTGLTRYVEVGLGVAALFVFLVGHIEPSARGGSLLFRLMITPGAVLLWPVIVVRASRVLTNNARARTAQRQVS
jgi:hypothetical protein